MDCLADLPSPELPANAEPVSLNAVNVQTTFMPSGDVLPWYPNDDDPSPAYQKRECCVKQIRVDTSNFTFDLYPEPVFDDNVFEDPVFASDDIDVSDYDLPTKVNLTDVGTINDYWSRDPNIITVNVVEINKDDPTAVRS